MRSVSELLEREAATVDLQGDHFERMLRRRDRKRRNQRVAAGALAIVLALVSFVALARAFDGGERPANEPSPNFTGMVIRFTGSDPRGDGDLVAVDPGTGESITLVAADSPLLVRGRIVWAATSADGRWVAYEASPFCDDRAAVADGEEQRGLWVTDGADEPRQLTAPCVEHPERSGSEGQWAWSPTGSRLAALAGDHLILIDPATGARVDLGQARHVTSFAWSPDGSEIAYAMVPTGSPDGNAPRGSIYTVSVDGGEHALVAESLGRVPGGEEGSGIRWSPDGTRLAVLADAGIPNGWRSSTTLYVLNADGSDRRPLAEGVNIEHILGSPNLAWSPDGTRIAYATFEGDRERLQIWNASSDGSDRIRVFVSGPEAGGHIGLSGGPVWSPDGTEVAFRYSPLREEKTWLIAGADGTGDAREIDELLPLSWRGGWYFCECYG